MGQSPAYHAGTATPLSAQAAADKRRSRSMWEADGENLLEANNQEEEERSEGEEDAGRSWRLKFMMHHIKHCIMFWFNSTAF